MAEGTIKKLIDKGFGFIQTGGGQDIYFHQSSLQGVSFDELQVARRCPTRKGRVRKAPVPRTSRRCSRAHSPTPVIARCTAFKYSVPSLAVGVKYPPSPFSFQA